jgi:hypothetical protein
MKDEVLTLETGVTEVQPISGASMVKPFKKPTGTLKVRMLRRTSGKAIMIGMPCSKEMKVVVSVATSSRVSYMGR